MRSDFIRMSYITMDLSDIERERRIRAFHVPGYRNKVHVKVGDRYFIYDPVFDARMRKKKRYENRPKRTLTPFYTFTFSLCARNRVGCKTCRRGV